MRLLSRNLTRPVSHHDRRAARIEPRLMLAGGIIFGVALVLVLTWSSPSPLAVTPSPDGSPSPKASASIPTAPTGPVLPKNPPGPSDPDAVAAVTARINALLAALTNPAVPLSPEEKRRLVAELVDSLLADRSPATAQAIIDFLKSGQDAATDMAFEVGPGGALTGWPSLRVALMDALGQISPMMAADVAKDVLSQKTSADEWAVALRNYGWAYSKTDPFLVQKVHELVTNQDWLRAPSTGFLEAFDTVVATQSTDLVGTLSTYLHKDAGVASTVPWASFLTIDRLVLQSPVATLSQILAQPALLQNEPQVRASFFARVDVRDPGQLAVLDTYLSSNLSDAEAKRFGELFPNYSQALSNTLLSGAGEASQGYLPQDKATLEVVKTWQTSGRFSSPATTAALGVIVQRLNNYVASGERGASNSSGSVPK